jgi:hypothetical protein
VAAVFELPAGYVGPVPVSICIAIPRLEPGHWLVHTLGCLPDAGPEGDEGLLHDSLVAIAARLGMTRVTATAQWDSPALAAHARVAPLRLRAAWLPRHDIAATAVFEHPIGAGAGPQREWVDASELEVGEPRGLQGLQRAIESGQVRYVVDMRARADGVRVPVIAAAAGQEPAR